MLILTRKKDERIIIGDNASIKVTVLEVRGNQVRLGIEAPKDISVHRHEIYERIHPQNKQSSLIENQILENIYDDKE